MWKPLIVAIVVLVAACSPTSGDDTTTTTESTTTTSASPQSTTTTGATATTEVPNRPPAIEIVLPEDLSVHTASFDDEFGDYRIKIAFSSVVSDPDGDETTVTWTSDVEGDLGTGTSVDAFISTGGSDASRQVITATVTDSQGASTSDSIQIVVSILSDT